MLPKWAFGYMQSKERYKSQDELIDIVKEFRQRSLPLDCIVLDWHYWPDGLWGQKSFDPACFPDPKLMMETIHRFNARLMISIWPIMNPDGDDWKEMQKHGLLLGNQATYDAFLPQAQQLYWDQANRGLFAHGIDAWWCDCAEPFESDWKGIEKPEPAERLRINTEEAKLYLDPEYINAYSLHHSKGIYEGQRKVTNDKRVVNLIRSAYAGQHRYATITWSGDISATWETLRTQIPEGLNFCASGAPYWTLDIGGFFVKNRPDLWFWSGDYDDGLDDLGFRELYVRWFQYGAFLPIFRSHGTDIAREIWQFGEPGDPFYEALVKFIHLRYRLMPYIYSLAGMVTHEDYTMMRALPFDFRDDPNTYNIKDQFMFGPAIMVNPVTHPMYFSAGSKPLDNVAKIRPVYLPNGCDWYDFWTGKRYSGGQTIAAESGLDIIPIFVRAGSIIPLGPDIQYVNEKPEAPLKLQIYPGRDGHFVLYEDEGDNYNYEQGAFSTTCIRWQDEQRQLIFEERQGMYTGMNPHREFEAAIISEDEVSYVQKFLYEGKKVIVGF
jgi:alpha-D-xyloside xylohydrolase